MKYDIFINSASKDSEYAELLGRDLSLKGFKTFFDRADIQCAQDFASEIISAINNCSVVLYLHSPNSCQSNWVQNELRYAKELGKLIIVINVGKVLDESYHRILGDLNSYQILYFEDLDDCDKIIKQIISRSFPNLTVGSSRISQNRESSDSKSMPAPSCFNESSSIEIESTSKRPRQKSYLKLVVWLVVLLLLSLLLMFFLERIPEPQLEEELATLESQLEEEQATLRSLIEDKQARSPKNLNLKTGEKCDYPDAPECNNNRSIKEQLDDVVICDSIIVDSTISDTSFQISSNGRNFEPNKGYSQNSDYDIDDSSQYISERENYYLIFLILASLLLGMVLYRLAKRKYGVKIHNQSSKEKLTLLVDGKYECEINPLEVVCVKRKKGEYMLTLRLNTDEDIIENIHQQFNKQYNNQIIPVELRQTNNNNFITYRCFIGGSTSIINERNAARSVLSILYNQYEKYNFYITAHTFEDFQNKHKIEGHQYEYDEFIRKKANCVIFIICKYVGSKTLDEYKVAINTFELTNGERPAIFVYNDTSVCDGTVQQDESINKFREFVDSKKAYWRDYKDIETLMLKMKDDISAELTNVLEMKPSLIRRR